MKILVDILRFFLKFIAGFFAFLLLYALLILITSNIPINNTPTKEIKEVPIYILSNGVHADIVMPLKSEIKDWSTEISYLDTKAKDSTKQLIAMGWGDKGFYLDTPTWADLKFSTALKATTGTSTAAMHITFYKDLVEDENCKKILISTANYKKLINYIEDSFLLDKNNKIQKIGNHSYGQNDVFYEAKGSYNLFYTCNTWANQALKASNQKAALFTVLDKGLLWQYE